MSVKLTGRESGPAVLAEMTLDEKIQLVSGGGSYSTAPIDRLGIPAALLIDNGAGVNFRHLITDCIKRGKLEGVDPNWGDLSFFVICNTFVTLCLLLIFILRNVAAEPGKSLRAGRNRKTRKRMPDANRDHPVCGQQSEKGKLCGIYGS